MLPGVGYPWWQDYQPVSYKLDSTRRGTRSEFVAMMNSCHAAGVKVYVDAVINHMTGGSSGGVGSAGSSYSHYDYPGIYQTQDFHHCGRNGNDDIVNYGDRYEVQNCELVDLADLATGSDYVRGRIAAYLNDLLAIGVDGFRLDASKHMPSEDIAAIKYAMANAFMLAWTYGTPKVMSSYECSSNDQGHRRRVVGRRSTRPASPTGGDVSINGE